MTSTKRRLANLAVAVSFILHPSSFILCALAPGGAGQASESILAPALTDIPDIVVGPADLETQTGDLGLGSIVAWGDNTYGQCNVPEPNNSFAAVGTGFYYSVCLRTDGSIVAWGWNDYGQCNVPAPNTGFVAVAGGWGHSLGLKADGSIVAWGDNTYGQCNVPTTITGLVAVAAGFYHSLALKSDGSIVAWGRNNYGQCNVPTTITGFVAIAAGQDHSLGLKADGSIVAWGYNGSGQCNVPEPNTGFVAVARGGHHSLALRADGSVVAWGSNSHGQLNVPEPNTGFVAVAGGWWHSLGLRADGSIVAWGDNSRGQCSVPAPYRDFAAAAAGWNHNLGMSVGGMLQVAIEPAQAVAVGAQWSVDAGTMWRDSGTSLGLRMGNYVVQFKDIAGWDTPSSHTVTIAADRMTTTTGTYVRHTGTLVVTIEPAGAVADGAQWSIDGGATWRDSGTSLTLPTGNYMVTFKQIAHWVRPASLAVTLAKDQLLERTGTYTAIGSLQVTIEPAEAVAAGAQWSMDGGAIWRASGALVVLTVGPYTVRFKPVAGRVTPADRPVTIEHRQTSQIAVYYNAPPNPPQLSIDPPQPRTLDTIQAIAQATDPDGDAIVEYQYQWLRGGSPVTTGTTVSPDLTAKGQQWELRARARDSVGNWGEWATLPFTIANTPPTQPVVEIRPQTPTPDRDLIVDVIEYSQDPDGDVIAYDFRWFLSRDHGQTWIHKAELDGSSQVSNEYVFEGDLWRVVVIPYERPPAPLRAMAAGQKKPGEIGPMTRVEGTPGWYQVYVGQNSLPQLQLTRLAGERDSAGDVRLQIAWTWRDDDGETCTVLLYWTDHGPHGLHAISGTLPAEQGGHDAVVAIPAGVPVHVHAIITDAKGAMTQVTSGAIVITEPRTAAHPAWLRAE